MLDAPVIQSLIFKQLVDKYMAQYVGKNPSTLGRLNYWITRFGGKQRIHIDEFDVDDDLVELSKYTSVYRFGVSPIKLDEYPVFWVVVDHIASKLSLNA